MNFTVIRLILGLVILFAPLNIFAHRGLGFISGKVISGDNNAADYVTVSLKGTRHGDITNEDGEYQIKAPEGEYTLEVTGIGYQPSRQKVRIIANGKIVQNITIQSSATELNEVTVSGNEVNRIKKSAYNSISIDTKQIENSTKNLADALAKAPGMKLRESGGVGSDLQVMMDGFSGKHVKIFIDGVAQEGVGSSFSINNIPVNYADHIEVYKGVVPVKFGTDAIGGVINIVTKKNRNNWFLDASYSYGSYNTHKSYLNWGQTFKNGLIYEINAFQNYSDNNYSVYAPVEDFATGRIDKEDKIKVKRFNDTFHNEAIVGKIGLVGKSWADKLMLGITLSQMYKEIQTGVRQEIVYGQKHRHGYTIMPSLEYLKRNLLLKGLDVALAANYNINATTNVDTASYKYNWLGETKMLNSPGEQAYIHSRANNHNWTGNISADYRFRDIHTITFNHVINSFSRSNTSLLTAEETTNPINKVTRKNISGLSYRILPSEKWNMSVFGKLYNLYVEGPIATSTAADNYVKTDREISTLGYGIAGTYYILPALQAKLSYEKASRLPTIEEMFGDEDLEIGQVNIKPESSDNINLNISYNKQFGSVHSLYLEGGLIYRNTQDYIQRNIADLSGGKYAATYINYGKVLTKGFNFAAKYGFKNFISIGGNFTHINVLDNMKTSITGNAPNLAYKERMPNLPYLFADSYINFNFHGLGKKGNRLTVTYDNQYVHSFSFYSTKIGASNSDYEVPTQFSHNVGISYSINKGKYNLALECNNITNEKLYDNFSLQKAGRAIYGKVRIKLGK